MRIGDAAFVRHMTDEETEPFSLDDPETAIDGLLCENCKEMMLFDEDEDVDTVIEHFLSRHPNCNELCLVVADDDEGGYHTVGSMVRVH